MTTHRSASLSVALPARDRIVTSLEKRLMADSTIFVFPEPMISRRWLCAGIRKFCFTNRRSIRDRIGSDLRVAGSMPNFVHFHGSRSGSAVCLQKPNRGSRTIAARSTRKEQILPSAIDSAGHTAHKLEFRWARRIPSFSPTQRCQATVMYCQIATIFALIFNICQY